MTRLFLKILTLLVVTNLLVVAGGYSLIKWLEHERLLIAPQQATEILAERVVDAWEHNRINDYAKKLGRHGTSFALLDENRNVLYAMPALKRLVENRARLLNRHREFRSRQRDRPMRPGHRRPQFTQEVNTNDGGVYYVISRSKHTLHNLLPQPAWKRNAPWIGGAIAIILASSLLSLYITRPIRSLRKTTQSLGQRDLSARVEKDVSERKDAIGELGRDFNRMAERLDDSQRNQHQLLRDISHELRSPLARIQVAGTLAEQKTGTSNELKRIDQETQRLDGLIETILRLTRLNDMPDLVFEPLDLSPIIAEIVRDARYEYQSTAKQINVNLGEIPAVYADYENLSSALENILRNAMYYTTDSGCVEITTQVVNKALEICIKDEGAGVPEEDLQRLFEPFFRSDSSRNEKTGSNGVGLAITHRIIELHDGKVWAENSPSGGLVVTIRLPTLIT